MYIYNYINMYIYIACQVAWPSSPQPIPPHRHFSRTPQALSKAFDEIRSVTVRRRRRKLWKADLNFWNKIPLWNKFQKN
jgi:hypothetical protein